MEFSRVDLLDRILVPVMQQVGVAYDEGRMRIAHEHLAYAVVRAFTDSLRGAYAASEESRGIIVATPVFQHHELGALLVAAVARSEGWRTTYLGPNLPSEEMVAAVKLRNCAVLALSITFPSEASELNPELRKLGRLLQPGVRLVVGGQAASLYEDALDASGASRFDDLADFRAFLAVARLPAGDRVRRGEPA